MPAIIRVLRPSQWLKNTFVFIPLIFSQNLFRLDFEIKSLIAFISFCFVSSAVYIFNDIVDREADRLHPTKSKRPIAAGEVGIPVAFAVSLILLVISWFLVTLLPGEFSAIVILYVVLQTLYSLRLKHIVVVDVFIIAIGFMLRVFSGAVAIDVVISHWLIITTLFLSLFLAVSKRRSELMLIQQLGIETKRKVLADYDETFLNLCLIITAAGMALSYSLYTMSERTITMFGTDYLIYTTIFVLFGIFRYLFLVITKGEGENPVTILVKDTPTALNFLVWVVVCIFIIYFSH